jgi:hypothetical protein
LFDAIRRGFAVKELVLAIFCRLAFNISVREAVGALLIDPAWLLLRGHSPLSPAVGLYVRI